MQVGRATFRCSHTQEGAESRVLRRGREEAVEECSKVETSASADDGEDGGGGKLGQGGAGVTGVVAGGAGLVGIVEVDEMVGNFGALDGRGLGGADLHVAIDADGVAGEDFCVEVAGQG